MLANLDETDKDFYRLFYHTYKTSSHFGSALIDFDAERLFAICKLCGLNVVSTATAFEEVKKVDNLPAVDSGVNVDDFVFSSKDSIDIMKQYCSLVSKEQCSTSHFATVNGCDLKADFLGFV